MAAQINAAPGGSAASLTSARGPVRTSRAKSPASFTLPAGIQTGASTLVVVANGIAAKPVSVMITIRGGIWAGAAWRE